MIESTEFGRSLPRRVASATASRICCRIQIWLAPTGTLHLEGRHAGVLADRPFAGRGLVDVLRDDRQRLAGARRAGSSAASAAPIAARTSGGRSVEVRVMSSTMLSRKCGKHTEQYN